MTEQEQRIRWMIKQDKEREFHPNMNDDIRFLIGEIDRLREEREKLIEGMRWYADDKTYKLGVNITMGAAFPLHEPIKSDKGIRARETLKSFGINI